MAPQPGGSGARFGVFELDVRAHELRKQGRRIHLQDKPFELLALLASRPGELVTRDELQRHLWPGDTFVVFDDNLNAAVRKAREALGDHAESPRFIETVPRHGYRFVAPVEPLRPPIGTEVPLERVDAGAARSAAEPRSAVARPGAPSPVSAVLVAMAAFVAVLLGLGWAVSRPRPGESGDPAVRFRIAPPKGHSFPPGGPRLAVSPDGQHVAFVAHLEPAVGRRVWLQSIDALTPRPVSGTDEAFDMFWAPDSRSLAFVAVGMLRTVELSTGVAVPLGLADGSSGGAWSQDAGVLVTEGLDAGLLLFPPGGAAPTRVTSPDPAREERWHRFPHFLPDGRTFLYLAESRRQEWSAIYLARLGEPGRRRLVNTPYKAEFVPPDQLVFVRNGRLVAQRLDLATATLTGVPIDLATPVFTSSTGEAWFSSSAAGVLASAEPPPPSPRDLTWFADDGRRLGTLALPTTCVNLALSPDDGRAALECRESQTAAPDIWVVEVADGTTRRVTANAANDESPVWSPDGRVLAYARHRAIRGEADVYTMDAEAPADGRPLIAADGPGEHPTSWSAHGDVLLVEQEGNVGKQDIWLVPLAPVAVARPWLATAHSEHRAVISPDGRWVAFESDRTGRPEVYVRPLAHPDVGEWSISTRGGRGPRWQRGGRALYYVSEDWQMMMVEPGASGSWSDVITRVLFELPGRTHPPGMPPAFDVTRDGRRFLVGPPPLAGADPPVTVVLNWRP